MRKKLLTIIMAGAMALSLVACGDMASETDVFLSEIQGEYVELFPEFDKEENRSTWENEVGAIVGEENASATVDMLLSMCMGDLYGDEAITEYSAHPENMKFNCYFIGGFTTMAVDGNVISGIDASGKEVFKHSYSRVEVECDKDFIFFKTDDKNAGQFTYFAFAPDTPASTFHLEFRYAENSNDLLSWTEGAYAYWNAGAIKKDYDSKMINDCIHLFATENLGGE